MREAGNPTNLFPNPGRAPKEILPVDVICNDVFVDDLLVFHGGAGNNLALRLYVVSQPDLP